jgi:hypothetical protein
MTRVVWPCMATSSARWTRRSFSASSALVASSSNRIGRLADQGAGDGQPLALAAREACGRGRRAGCRSPRAGRSGTPRPGRRGPRRAPAGRWRCRARSGCCRRRTRRTAGSPGRPAPCGRGPRPDRRRAGPPRPAAPWPSADRRSAAAGGRPCSCPRPTGRPARPARPAHVQREALQRRQVGAARIGEGDALEGDRPQRWDRLRQRTGLGGGCDAGLRVQQFAHPLHGAGGLLHVAPGLAQGPDRAGGHDRQERELEQGAPAHLAAHGALHAQPEDHHDAAEHEADDQGGHDGARRHPGQRGAEGLFHRRAETGRRRSPRDRRPARSPARPGSRRPRRRPRRTGPGSRRSACAPCGRTGTAAPARTETAAAPGRSAWR